MKKFVSRGLLAAVVCLTTGATTGFAGTESHGHPAAQTQAANIAQVTGTLHGIDAKKGTVNIEHPAVPEFQWPGMQMDFTVAKAVKLDGLKAGQKVRFTITKSAQGEFAITELAPAN
ncbi:MAG: copper-binding protein [Magnetococcales bacterium]|nr:copper-binding protein [Magnetococcales bacterium]